MQFDLDLPELGARIEKIDLLLMALIQRRMELSTLVGKRKLRDREQKPEKGGRKKRVPFVRLSVEKKRVAGVRAWARKHKMNPHFAEAILYAIISESCKQQLIQLQNAGGRHLRDPESDDQRYRVLKRNLLRLTERWSHSYDQDYDRAYFATHAYLEFESFLLAQEIGKLSGCERVLDLGCATGRLTIQLAERFPRAVGYDISPDMIRCAKAKFSGAESVVFEEADLEAGIPEADSSVSFVVMNLGTASDVRDLAGVLKEVERVLLPGGRFLLSFYNREALVYRWDFIPWPIGLAAEFNVHKRCLDVHSGDKLFSVYARSYTRAEVQDLFRGGGLGLEEMHTYPTVSSVLPSDFFKDQPEVRESVVAIDRSLSASNMGAYIVVTGVKA